MRAYLAFILFTIPLLLNAQVKKHKKKPMQQIHKQSMNEFYSVQKLMPDSATTPYLYYKVYDWIGTRYKYSGDTKNGIDCSGFVCQMYEDAYCIRLEGGSKDIWTTVKPIEKEDLKEGDILFFKIKKGQISHVGIYLGNNKFAHASVQSGVTISDLNEDYYKKRFYKGGRLVQ
jgi:murein DD-endopeptidase / murein LD-carboxypeptidase